MGEPAVDVLMTYDEIVLVRQLLNVQASDVTGIPDSENDRISLGARNSELDARLSQAQAALAGMREARDFMKKLRSK